MALLNKKRQKFSVESVFRCLSIYDLGCSHYDIIRPKQKKIILFDGDERGNGNGPFLELKFYQKHAKIHRGYLLTKEEKKLCFPYRYCHTVDDFADYLADFIKKYFASFKIKYVRDT